MKIFRLRLKIPYLGIFGLEIENTIAILLPRLQTFFTEKKILKFWTKNSIIWVGLDPQVYSEPRQII